MPSPQPQSFFPKFPIPRLNSILPIAMPNLVSPPVNSAVAVEISDLLTASQPFLKDSHAERDTIHSALLLLADDLDNCHRLCQNIPTSYGSAWHAIMHRREGDFSNSKYWWRRATNIAWPNLAQQLSALLTDAPRELADWRDTLSRTHHYDPTHFIDLVDRLHEKPTPQTLAILLQVQRLEWSTLFLECLPVRNY